MPSRARLELEVEVGSEPITGRVALRPGAWEEFVGWIQLTSLLVALAEQAGADQPERA